MWDPRPNRSREIVRPPSRRDLARRRFRREIGSGGGLHCSAIAGFGRPEHRLRHRDLAGGGNGGPADPAPARQAPRLARQRREPRDMAQLTSGRFAREAPHLPVAALRHLAGPIPLARLTPLRHALENGAGFAGLGEPVRIVAESDEPERIHRAASGNGHRTAQHRLGLARGGERVAKGPPPPSPTDPGRMDAEGLRNAPDLVLPVLAPPDRARICPDGTAEPVGLLAADMGPTGAASDDRAVSVRDTDRNLFQRCAQTGLAIQGRSPHGSCHEAHRPDRVRPRRATAAIAGCRFVFPSGTQGNQ